MNINPGTYNFLYKNQEKKYVKNIKYNYAKMIQLGWESPTTVVYNINSLGFRSNYEFIPNEPCNLYLGCSYTFGEELQYENVYTSIVNNYLNDYKMYNLGVLGASTTTCYRVLQQYINIFDIKRVFILKPYTDRKEFFYNNKWENFSISTVPFNDKKLVLSIFNKESVNFDKDMATKSIKYICLKNKINLYELDIDDVLAISKVDNDRTARDLWHLGKYANSYISSKFIEMLENEQ